jgi:hypothetical protein
MTQELPAQKPPLDIILRSEIESGNELAEIQLGGRTEVDIVVGLKFPFRTDYREEFPDTAFYRDTDAHYSLTDSYSAVHLADEVIAETVFDKAKVVERTANLLYAIRLVAPEHPLRKAAELLLADANAAADD